MEIIYLAMGVFFVWICILSFFVFKTRAHYFNLITKSKRKNLDEIMETLLEKDKILDEELSQVKKTLFDLDEKEKLHYQKIGFLRFNPFDRMGGEQSFIITLLNREESGIVLNFLYTREGLRVYSKRVKHGKSEEYALSKEEIEAMKNSH